MRSSRRATYEHSVVAHRGPLPRDLDRRERVASGMTTPICIARKTSKAQLRKLIARRLRRQRAVTVIRGFKRG